MFFCSPASESIENGKDQAGVVVEDLMSVLDISRCTVEQFFQCGKGLEESDPQIKN